MILRTSIVIFHAWWILLTPRTHVLVKFVFPIPLDTGVAQMLYNMQLCLIWHQGCLILYIIPRIWPRPILKSLRTGKQGIIPILKTTQKPADHTKENNSVQVINSCCPVQWGKKSVFESRLHFNSTPNCSGRELRENGGLMLTSELLSYLKTIWTG